MATQAQLFDDQESLLRSKRRQSLPEEERGLVYWEEWCQDEGYGTIPTWETLALFVRDFVAPMEENINRLAHQNSSVAPIVASRVFIEPVLNLRCNRKHNFSSNLATRSTLSNFEESPSNVPQSTIEVTRRSDHGNTVPFSSSPSIPSSVTDIHSFASTKQPPSIHSQMPSSEIGSDPYSNERCPPVGLSHLASSHPTPVASTVVASGGSDILLSPPSVHDNHLYHSPQQQDQLTQSRDQHQLNYWDASGNNDFPLYSRFNFQGFKFVPAAYSSASIKATLPGLPEYGFRTEVKSTQDVLQEWRFGYKGRPAIQDLNNIYPSRWWEDQAHGEYENRWMIVWEFVRLCGEKNLTSEEAVEVLEELRGDTGSLQKLVDAIRAQHFYGLTIGLRIQQTGISTVAADEPGQNHCESVSQCDRTVLERNDSRSVSKLPDDPYEFDPMHEPNHTSKDLKFNDSGSAFEQRPIPTELETNNDRTKLLIPNGTQKRPKIQKRKRCYRSKSIVDDDSDSEESYKVEKTRRKKQMKTRQDSRNDTGVKKRHNSPKRSLEDNNQEPFPMPVRNTLTISDIWKEWTVGWEGEPSIESLIAIHGRSWRLMKRHLNHFTYRCRIVRVISAALKAGAVACEEEACAEIEKLRDTQDCTPLKLTQKNEFKELVLKWERRESIPK